MMDNTPAIFLFFILSAIISTAQTSEACVICGLKHGARLAQTVAIDNENNHFLKKQHALQPAGRALRLGQWKKEISGPFVGETIGSRSSVLLSNSGTDYVNGLDSQGAVVGSTSGREEGTVSLEKSEDSTQSESKQGERKDPVSGSMVATIGFYKNIISPLLPPACRFLPTCSQYGVEAIERFGPMKGTILTAWRILRCSPFGGRGYDPPCWPPVFYTYGSY
jgi:putative membrane protein insertion efficiency factor